MKTSSSLFFIGCVCVAALAGGCMQTGSQDSSGSGTSGSSTTVQNGSPVQQQSQFFRMPIRPIPIRPIPRPIPTVPRPIPVPVPPSPITTTVSNLTTHKCLDDLGWSKASGAALGQWECDADRNQDFELTLQPDGAYVFKNAFSGYCLETATPAPGSGIIQSDCNGSEYQEFTLAPVAGGYQIVSKSSGLCVSIPGDSASNGVLVQQAACASQASQDFEIAKVPGPSPAPSTPVNPPTGGPGIPTPPAIAVTIQNIQNLSSWKPCNGACSSCPAYNPNCEAGVKTSNMVDVVQQIGDPNPLPVRDSDKAGLFQVNAGPAYATSLWGHSISPSLTYTNFIWDFWMQTNTSQVENQEFDLYTVMNHHQYMIGSQCNHDNGIWQGWNNGTQHWIDSAAPCPKFAPGQWHHVIMYVTANPSAGTYDYHVIQIDGTNYPMNLSNEPATGSNWGAVVGVQVQLDQNSTGMGISEYVENMQVTMW